jgi:hypothetical protein
VIFRRRRGQGQDREFEPEARPCASGLQRQVRRAFTPAALMSAQCRAGRLGQAGVGPAGAGRGTPPAVPRVARRRFRASADGWNGEESRRRLGLGDGGGLGGWGRARRQVSFSLPPSRKQVPSAESARERGSHWPAAALQRAVERGPGPARPGPTRCGRPAGALGQRAG